MIARNNASNVANACLITDATVQFTEPGINGLANGTTHTLITGATLEEDGSTDLCFIGSTAPPALDCPADTIEVIDDDLSYVVAVNTGVPTATAAARIIGPRPPSADCPQGGAAVHISAEEDDACAANTISVAIPNATIRLSPLTDTNEVNSTHQITCHIRIHNGGSGAPFQNAPNGTICNANIDSGPGGFVGNVDTCAVDGGDGNCILTITSNVTGKTVVSACTQDLVVNTVSLMRWTDGTQVAPLGCPDDPDPGGPQCFNGNPVEKFWVSAPPSSSRRLRTRTRLARTTCSPVTVQVDIGDGNRLR